MSNVIKQQKEAEALRVKQEEMEEEEKLGLYLVSYLKDQRAIADYA